MVSQHSVIGKIRVFAEYTCVVRKFPDFEQVLIQFPTFSGQVKFCFFNFQGFQDCKVVIACTGTIIDVNKHILTPSALQRRLVRSPHIFYCCYFLRHSASSLFYNIHFNHCSCLRSGNYLRYFSVSTGLKAVGTYLHTYSNIFFH